MFGDLALTNCITVVTQDAVGGTRFIRGMSDIPVPGGARTGKIAENDIALPVDRIFFGYNHFHNVLTLTQEQIAPAGPTLTRQQPIEQRALRASAHKPRPAGGDHR